MKTNLLKSIFISLILLVGATNAWAYDQSAVDLYFDNSEAKWTNCYVYIGHGSYTSCYAMSRVSGTQYLWKLPSNFNGGNKWGGATGWVVCKEKWWDSQSESIDKYTWHGAKNVTKKSTSAWSDANIYKTNGTTSVTSDGNTINAYAVTSYTKNNYTVTIKTATGGTLTVKDYDNNTVSNGASKIHLTVLKFSATASTGYTFSQVQINNGGTTTTISAADIASKTYTLTSNVTITPIWTPNTYTITYKDKGNATFSGTHASGYPTKHTYGTATTLKTASKTGYTFDGWFTSSNCSGSAISSLSATGYTADITLYAKWTAKNITINWNANGGSVTPTSSTYTYDGDAITLPTPSYAGHRFLGWFTAADGGTQITNVGTTNKPYEEVTYYAHWEVSIVEHKVTFGVGTGSTSYGTLTAATSSGNISSGANIVEGTSVTFTATPKTGYEVKGWYTNAACTEGEHDAGNTTYTTTITAPTNVYVKFVEKTWSVTFVAGTGGTIAEPASSPKTVGEVTGITVIAEAEKGYTFSGWTSSNGGKFDDSKSEKTTFKPTAATTVTANFNENLYAITVKSNNESFGTVSPESGTAGIDTKFTIIATPKLGYKFVSWKTDAGITVADSESQETTVNATAAGTITANFELIPPTTIYIKSDGYYADFKWNYNSVAYDMTPMDCAGTYYTADVLGGIDEITLTGSNSFTTTTLTVPTDGKTLYDLTSTKITHLYLKPNSNWTSSSAWFAAYFFGNGEKWVKMLDEDGDGIYSCEIPTDKTYPSVILVRMNSAKSALSWDSKWDQTNDLTVPTDGKNLYTVAAGAWSNGNGSWSTVWDNSRWATFEAPTLNVQVKITGKGSIVIDGETYASITTGTETFAFTKASGEKIAVGAITPEDRWALTSRQITMCDETIDLAASHTISGPATINLSFTQTSCEVIFNLNLPKGTEHPIIPAQYVAVGEKATKPTLNEINGYIFGGWYSDRNCTQAYNFENSVTTDITIHAKWVLHSQCIFFKNTLSWSDVYVYTFTDNAYWNDGTGVHPGTNKLEQGKMTQLDKTDIYYYILTDLTGFSNIAFSDYDMRDYGFFNDHKAIYRSDRSDQLQLFIPKTDQKPTTVQHSKNQYYSSGIWMKYNSTESGYDWRGATSEDEKDSGWSNAFNFTASKPGGYTFKASVTFNSVDQRFFKIHNIKDDWFGNGGTMTQNNCTNWTFGADNGDNAEITPTVTGTYIFTIYLGDGEVKVSLDFPLSTGDYRLVYVDNVTGVHPSHYIKKRNEDRLDTVSFFVHHQNSPRILLQHCTAIDKDGVPTWETDKEYQILKTGGADPATAMLPGKRKSDGTLYIGEGCGIDSTGVYNFVLQQTSTTVDLQTDYTHPYVGDFYIRTDAADGGWDSFRQQSNKITYSSFADSHSNFNHYYCKYIDAGRNVKFTIANDYSYCISDTLDNDPIIEKGQSSLGCLPINANVRFGWNSHTNEISRAYIKGAGQTSDRFLVLQGKDNNLKDANGKDIPVGTDNRYGLKANEEILVDQQNWIYRVDVTANQATEVKLVADYNGTTQYFKGNAEEYTQLLSSNATKGYKIRLVYDFKSNHLIIAWLAGGNTVEGEQTLGADMMVIRQNQDPADQLNFNPQSSPLKEVETGYAVMTFTQAHITDNSKSQRERSLYWVSFPFDVNIADVFGFGEYAEHWILQYYDGAERAEKGLFIDSGTYWKYIEDKNTKLKAGEGYVLVLDLSKVEFLYGATEVSLYFPSTGPLNTISGEVPTAAIVPEHQCNIDREWTEGTTTYHHKYTDSHWNLIGVPGFADIKGFDVTAYHFMQEDASFYYNFNLANSKYTVENAATNFQAMYAYMVQFAGTINWESKTVIGETPQPQELAARRYSDELPEKVVLRLEFAQGQEVADRTFVQLQQEGATANFDMNLDLTKIVNKGANIYTLTDSLKIQVAGNVLPFEETTVAVGVEIAAAGEYTFRMPDGTENMVVELIDYETNTTTNLLLDNYTVNLPTGSNETRFALSLKPEKTATSIESTTTPSDSNIRKFIIDGKLYLQKDGMLYDAQGKLVR